MLFYFCWFFVVFFFSFFLLLLYFVTKVIKIPAYSSMPSPSPGPSSSYGFGAEEQQWEGAVLPGRLLAHMAPWELGGYWWCQFSCHTAGSCWENLSRAREVGACLPACKAALLLWDWCLCLINTVLLSEQPILLLVSPWHLPLPRACTNTLHLLCLKFSKFSRQCWMAQGRSPPRAAMHTSSPWLHCRLCWVQQ